MSLRPQETQTHESWNKSRLHRVLAVGAPAPLPPELWERILLQNRLLKTAIQEAHAALTEAASIQSPNDFADRGQTALKNMCEKITVFENFDKMGSLDKNWIKLRTAMRKRLEEFLNSVHGWNDTDFNGEQDVFKRCLKFPELFGRSLEKAAPVLRRQSGFNDSDLFNGP